MKKLLTILLSLFVFTSAYAESFFVKSFVGKVQYEEIPGVYKNVEVGLELYPATFITTSLNSELILLREDGSEIKIKAMQKGSINELSKKRITSKGIKTSTIAPAVEGTSKGVATASSRASDAKEDLDWED
ncbi:MAG: hypothetical protein IKK93_12090 [Campylobacter sp.]|nr:hypothetical protein [Campylobacter sp.]